MRRTGEIKLRDFGHFTVSRKAPGPGRNPRTGEKVPIEARHVVRFRASPTLKSAVQTDRPPRPR
jgi:integration host factor subunit alpha